MDNYGRYYSILVIWFIVAAVAGYTGVVENVMPPLILFSLVIILILAALGISSFRAWICSFTLNELVSIHLTRLVGFYFLYLYAEGRLPYEFAVYGGWGDIIIAALAMVLLVLSAEKVIKNPVYYYIWNLLGLIDILFVVGTAARLYMANPESMAELTRLPLSLLPTFLVPIIIFSHIVIFYRLRKNESPVV